MRPDEIPLLKVRNFSKTYGDYQALKDISFDVQPNEIMGLIGPNGSGKTTLLEGLSGLLPLNNGSVLKGDSPLSIYHRKDELFYLPDGILPYSEMPVSFALDFFRKLSRAKPSRLSEVVSRLELEQAMPKRVGALSKGFSRRYLLAVALLSVQPLLVLDEPFDGLDLRQTMSVISLLEEVCSSGRSLLLSIHQLSDAQKICRRFILLDNGVLLGQGTLDQLREQAGLSEGGLEEVFLALT